MAEKVVRGKIISSDGKVLAQTLTENEIILMAECLHML